MIFPSLISISPFFSNIFFATINLASGSLICSMMVSMSTDLCSIRYFLNFLTASAVYECTLNPSLSNFLTAFSICFFDAFGETEYISSSVGCLFSSSYTFSLRPISSSMMGSKSSPHCLLISRMRFFSDSSPAPNRS